MHPLIPLSAFAAAFLLLRRDPSKDGGACALNVTGYAYLDSQPADGVPLAVKILSGEGKEVGTATVAPWGNPMMAVFPDGRSGRAVFGVIKNAAGRMVGSVPLYFV